MKTIIKNAVKLFTVLLILLSGNTYAQDPVDIAPKNYKKVLLENDKLKMDITGLTAGIYLLNIQSHEFSHTEKLIITK